METAVGTSSRSDATQAGAGAVEEALSGIDDPKLVYFFASSQYDLDALLSAADEQLEEVPLAGCSSMIEITPDGPEKESVVALAIGGDDVHAHVGFRTGLEEGSEEAGYGAASEALGGVDEKKNTFLTVLSDPLHGTGVDMLAGVNRAADGDVQITGEFAADNMEFEHTHVFHNGEAHEDAVICVAVSTDREIATDKAHGFQPTPNSYTVTESDTNVVKELEGRPPQEVYAEIFGDGESEDPAFLLMTPFGLDVEGEDEYMLRVTLDVDEKGCYACGASVPEGDEVHIMMGQKEDLLDAAASASGSVADQLGGTGNVEAALVFSCVGRDAIYDDPELTQEEVQRVHEQLGEGTSIIGLYGFGQIAMSGGNGMFHEETISIQGIGSR
ncbi:MAG: FIST N-terminal domain-containing protein [Candidatus Nanohaloarchaea archaeon]|nr:FIST N-terminal domain-containing protein [Candidatus Nanohaloarchaea archaeon]